MGAILNYLALGGSLIVSSLVYLFSSIPFPAGPPPEPIIPIATLESVGSTTPLREQIGALSPDPGILAAIENSPILGTSTPAISTPVPSITPSAPVPTPAPRPAVVVPTPAPAPAPAPLPAPEPQVPTSALEKLAAASVNILCTGNGGEVRGMSGSGVLVSQDGVIMTVAHVAQYYLLLDHPSPGSVVCQVRTGSPARATYIARPLYVSEQWIKDNPSTLLTQAPKGSGEGDFAFLKVSGSVAGHTTTTFPYVVLGTSDPKKGATVHIAAYPAQTLSGSEVRMSLPMTTATTNVIDRFTFKTNQVDVVSLAGNQAAQTGSSGGGVVNESGELIGMITTSSTEGPYASRRLHAITTNYIRRSFKEQTGSSLDSFLSSSRVFENDLVSLRAILLSAFSGS